MTYYSISLLAFCTINKSMIGYLFAQTAAPTNVQPTPRADYTQEDGQEYNCEDPSLWSNNSLSPQKGHDFKNCNVKWALKNSNDAAVLSQLTLQKLDKKITDAKKNNDTAILQQFINDGICDPSHRMNDCYEHIKRRVVSHTLQNRENMLLNNRLISEVTDDGKDGLQGKNQKSKMLTERMDELRQEKKAPVQNPCAKNPFIPCIVSYGDIAKKSPQSLSQDQSTKALVDGSYQTSAVQSTVMKSPTGTRDVEIQSVGQPDKALRSLIDYKLESKSAQNTFSKQEYAQDLKLQKAAQEKKLTDEINQKSDIQQDPVGAHWSALNEALDELVALRRRTQTADELVSFIIRIEDDPNSKKLSTDGIIRDTILNL